MGTYRRVQDISHDIGADGSLALSVTSAEVRLAAVPGTRARVRATFEIAAADDAAADDAFEALNFQVHPAQGSLRVEEIDVPRGLTGALSRLLGSRGSELVDVEVEAPPRCALEVRVVSSDVQATGFGGAQRFQTVSGDLRLTDAGGSIQVDAVSGDVVLRAVTAVELRANQVSGDLSAEAPSFRRLRANSVSGDVSIEGALEARGTHAVDTVSGDVRLAATDGVTVAVRGLSTDVRSALPHRLEGGPDRRRLIIGDGAAQLTFNSMSGDLAVVAPRQASASPAAASVAAAAPADGATFEVLGALERGEIDVEEAMRRLDRGAR